MKYPEVGGNEFLRNVSICTKLQTSQSKKNTVIFTVTVVRTSYSHLFNW